MNATCVNCDKTATRTVHIKKNRANKAKVVSACSEHARIFATEPDLFSVFVRLMTLTTNAMPAVVRTRHTKAVIVDNGLMVGKDHIVGSVTSELDGPTMVSCDPHMIKELRKILRFQGWGVFRVKGVKDRILVEHPRPAHAPDEISPGLMAGMRVVRIDELDKIEQVVSDLLELASDEESSAYRAVLEHLSYRRAALKWEAE